MSKHILGLAVICAFLTSCATPYQQKGFMGGYSDTLIDSNTARVSFYGNAFTNKDAVENNMLKRCAEITIQKGYQYFVILTGETEPTVFSYTSAGTYNQNTTVNMNAYGNNVYGIATTNGTYTPGQTTTFRKYESSVLIKMFNDPKPSNALDANEIIRNLK